jgi:hypothetical protein
MRIPVKNVTRPYVRKSCSLAGNIDLSKAIYNFQHNKNTFKTFTYNRTNMSTMNVFFVSLLVSMLLGIDSFTLRPASTSVALTIKSQRTGSNLSVVLARHENDQSTYQYILNKAREFAFSETTTSQEAKQYLQYILELESACVSGSFVGSDVCDNVTELTDIVAHLRQKANQQQAIIGRYEIDSPVMLNP